jgi:hypothetical protein
MQKAIVSNTTHALLFSQPWPKMSHSAPPPKEVTMKAILGILMGLVFINVASADTVWTYDGNSESGASNVPAENPCDCAIDGTVVLDAAGNAIAWNFTDGTHTLTQANSSGTINPSPLHNGTFFSTWGVVLQTGNGIVFASNFIGSTFEATDAVSVNGSLFMFEQGNHGVWTETVPTPEPATGLLVACGLTLGLWLRKRKSVSPL